ncbi:MAG TPA: ABC transporter permease [Gemmatimonadaceae bacterium]
MRLYRLLLHLYPASFRREFGAELRQAFALRRREASGLGGIALLWLETVPEVIGNAVAAHWDILVQDLRYARRTLARTWGFALTAVLVSALGVGATAAAFSVTDFVLLRPLPFQQPGQLVDIWEKLPGYAHLEVSPANFVDWQTMAHSFRSMGAYSGLSANLIATGEPQRVQGAWVTYDLLSTLGVTPYLGRAFTAADDRSGAAGTVLLSYAFWQSEFGGDRAILGRSIRLDGESYRVIGVMRPDFQFPDRTVQFWTPFRWDRASSDFQDRTNFWLNVVGRLRPGTSLDAARADMETVASRLETAYPVANKDASAAVYGMRDELSQQSRLLLWSLSGAALCILLIACANLGNLMLVRGVARQRELAVRTALGAGRERLVRQMLTETLLLIGAGWLAGVFVGIAGVPLLARLVPDALPVAGIPPVDLRVLAGAGALALLTSVAFATLPAWRATRRAGLAALRDGRGVGGGRTERVRAALVTFEVTASVVLLIAAGLLLRSVQRIEGVDPGFRVDGLLTVRTALAMPKYATVESRDAFYRRVLDGVRAIPGVTNAAYTSWLPLTWGGGIWNAEIPGKTLDRSAGNSASIRYVTPGYFATMGIPVRGGRAFDDHDTQQAPYVAIVSESFAKRYWPDGPAVGRQFKMTFSDRTIVGVVPDVKVRGLDRSSEPQVYFPAPQVPDSFLTIYTPKDLAIRTSAPASLVMPAVRRIIHEADPEQPLSNARSMADIVAAQTASRAAQLRVLGMLAALAFLLAGVGLHGLLAFAVSQRAREIGVRMALGANAGNVVAMVVRRGVSLAVLGVLPGLALAYAAGRAMQAVLFQVSPADPGTLTAVVVLVIVMTLAGCVVPARRAARVDPMRVLRGD